ncbi:MAG: proline dehydrogenase family protein, partial [Deltaproteobacteria bacterium]|nr:proline dehydrogenase family protein [Deltaproteobacteria bacterium]MBW2071810.1 proline dehydrogenase family protein [Deltaproteobacteria bacterium]
MSEKVNDHELEARIKARGRSFFASIRGETPSIFNKGWWTGKVMDWCMKNEHFKVQLFRFVDVLPYLTTTESLGRHIEEYFAAQDQELPAVLKWGARGFGSGITTRMLARTIRSNIESMAKQFIVGENIPAALKTIDKLRREGFAFSVDILGEATVSKAEALHYLQQYLALLSALGEQQHNWIPLEGRDSYLDWGHAPKVNISVKPTSLYSQTRPADFAGSVEGIYQRLSPVVARAMEIGGSVCIDMEQFRYKDITLEVYRRLRSAPQFRDFPYLAVVLQS